MPRRDGSGPVGNMTRRNRNYSPASGFGRACGFRGAYGLGRMRNCTSGFPRFIDEEMEVYDLSEKDILNREKDLLETRLEFLNRQLDGLDED